MDIAAAMTQRDNDNTLSMREKNMCWNFRSIIILTNTARNILSPSIPALFLLTVVDVVIIMLIVLQNASRYVQIHLVSFIKCAGIFSFLVHFFFSSSFSKMRFVVGGGGGVSSSLAMPSSFVLKAFRFVLRAHLYIYFASVSRIKGKRRILTITF